MHGRRAYTETALFIMMMSISKCFHFMSAAMLFSHWSTAYYWFQGMRNIYNISLVQPASYRPVNYRFSLLISLAPRKRQYRRYFINSNDIYIEIQRNTK